MAALLAFVLVAGVLRDRREMLSVVVPTRVIAAGEPVTLDAVRVIEVPSSSELGDGVVTEAEVTAGGVVAQRVLVVGEPVPRSAVGEASGRPATRVMSLPLDGWGAAGGELQVGDQIDVIDTRTDETTFVVKSASVVARSTNDSGGGLAGSERGVWVAIEVSDGEALRIAAVVQADRFVLVRSTGVGS